MILSVCAQESPTTVVTLQHKHTHTQSCTYILFSTCATNFVLFFNVRDMCTHAFLHWSLADFTFSVFLGNSPEKMLFFNLSLALQTSVMRF